MQFRGPAAGSPRRQKSGGQSPCSVAKKPLSIVFGRAPRSGTVPGERIAWVLEVSGVSNHVKTEAESIAIGTPCARHQRAKGTTRAFLTAAYASREALVSFSPQRERTDTHDPRSLRTESFHKVTPTIPRVGPRLADFVGSGNSPLGGAKCSKPLCFSIFLGTSDRFAAEG